MLFSNLSFSSEFLGAAVSRTQGIHEQMRFSFHERRSVIGDNAIVPYQPSPRMRSWPMLVLTLAGSGRVKSHRRTLELGPYDVVLLEDSSDYGGRNHLDRGDVAVAFLQWNAEHYGTSRSRGLTSNPLSACHRAPLSALVKRFDPRRPAEFHAALAEMLRLLAADGLPVPRLSAAELTTPVDAIGSAVLQAVDATLSNLTDDPKFTDLERRLGYSRAHAKRLLKRIGERFDLPIEAWHAQRQRWRFMVACMLLSSPHTTVEEVAHAVGYGHPSALCRSFAREKLPSPGNVARLIHALA
jgi:AraC-like DNA-binding protein